MIYLVAIGGILAAVSLIFTAVEFVTGGEVERANHQRLMKEISRHRPERWAIHDKVTIVPKEDT